MAPPLTSWSLPEHQLKDTQIDKVAAKRQHDLLCFGNPNVHLQILDQAEADNSDRPHFDQHVARE